VAALPADLTLEIELVLTVRAPASATAIGPDR
jgi:hypothetical protein